MKRSTSQMANHKPTREDNHHNGTVHLSCTIIYAEECIMITLSINTICKEKTCSTRLVDCGEQSIKIVTK